MPARFAVAGSRPRYKPMTGVKKAATLAPVKPDAKRSHILPDLVMIALVMPT